MQRDVKVKAERNGKRQQRTVHHLCGEAMKLMRVLALFDNAMMRGITDDIMIERSDGYSGRLEEIAA